MSVQADKLDRLIQSCTEIVQRLSAVEATLVAWQKNIDRFYETTMPRIEGSLETLDRRVDHLERQVEGLRTRVAVIGAAIGAAAAAAVGWVKHLFGAS